MAKTPLSFDQVNVRDTIRRLVQSIQRRDVKQQDIVAATKIEKSKLSRWLNEQSGWSSIGHENYSRIVDFVAERNLFSQASYERPEEASLRDMAFHGLVGFLGCDARMIDQAREELVGSYVGWRFSYFAPPDILKGALEITYDEQSHALRVAEHFKVPADAMGEGSDEINFKRVGYVWPTQHNMYLMLSQKVGFRDIQVAYLNKSLVNAITLEKGAMHTIEGVVGDWQGPDFYFTKLVLHKVAKPIAVSEIGLKTDKEVPNAILAKLRERFIGPHNYLRVYK